MEFNDVLNRRYSCRSLAAQGLEKDKLDRILEAGRIAPTAVNKQPVHIWAVSNPETLEAIKGVTRSNYGAPLLLVVAMINVGYPAPDSKPSAMHGARKTMDELVTRV